MALYRGTLDQGRIPYIANNDTYDAEEGGEQPSSTHPELITVAQIEEGDCTVVVAASTDGTGSEVNASYDLSVTALPPDTSVTFDGGSKSGTLIDNQVHYFQIEVPETIGTDPVLGWILDLTETTGDASLRLRKGEPPYEGSPDTLASNVAETIVTPPFLSGGTWFVAVKASGLTNYTLTSDPVRPERTWSMPALGGTYSQPGLTEPFFGDTGIDDNGNNIVNPETGDLGTDLAQGHYHFFKVVVPAGNGGLLRTALEALSGDPELYIRRDIPATKDHDELGSPGYIYERSLLGTGTTYGNWVPFNGKYETELPPGDWWISVWANNTNVRYRLKLSTGTVQAFAQSGGNVANQALAAGDMRYYKLQVPQSALSTSSSTPLQWTINLSQAAGDVAVFVRDTIPPGQGSEWSSYLGSLRDWKNDNSYLYPDPYVYYDATGNHVLTVPPVKPGHTYYLGVFAKTDATFGLSSSIGTTRLALQGIINFYGGSVTSTISPGSRQIYRIDVPSDATRWQHAAQHSDDVNLYISQSTVPPRDDYAHWRSTESNSSYSTYLLGSDPDHNYPWQPGHSYYLLVENVSSSTLPFTFTMDGRNLNTEDEDNDDMADQWETYYFKDLSRDGTGDYDKDGLTDLEEFQAGTDPTDWDSDNDGMPDGWEVDHALNPLVNDAKLDPDKDGWTNLQEYQNNTDPHKRDARRKAMPGLLLLLLDN